jgi:hypothetical protein
MSSFCGRTSTFPNSALSCDLVLGSVRGGAADGHDQMITKTGGRLMAQIGSPAARPMRTSRIDQTTRRAA